MNKIGRENFQEVIITRNFNLNTFGSLLFSSVRVIFSSDIRLREFPSEEVLVMLSTEGNSCRAALTPAATALARL